MASAAISGDYVDLKFIKSRKVAQIVLEIPIEAGEAFVHSFGTPSPAGGVPVALARINTAPVARAPHASEPERERRPMSSLPLPQQAALLCDRGAFARFARERHGYDDATAFLREWCGVESRADIKPGSLAAERFHEIRDIFDVWMKVPA